MVTIDQRCYGHEPAQSELEGLRRLVATIRQPKAVATCTVDAIIKDLSDRRGLSSEWEGIDEDIRNEIRDTWIALGVKAASEEK